MTKPTPEQIQRACDLVNSECRAGGDGSVWNPLDFYVFPGLKVLADTIAQLDAKDAMVDGQAALIVTLTADRDKATADLAEIDRIAAFNTGSPLGTHTARLDMILGIAAPYRVETDPLVEALIAANAQICDGEAGYAPILRAELAKRGLEIGRSA